ncbi:unnamed protein product [Leuciscus chuanchicus]
MSAQRLHASEALGGKETGQEPVNVYSSTGHQGSKHVTPKLKLKWKCKKDDASNAGYSHECLQNLFQKYGDVLNILISSKKKGSAVVEFASVKAADLAIKNEIGLTGNPLKITWLEGQSALTTHTDSSDGVYSAAQPQVCSRSPDRGISGKASGISVLDGEVDLCWFVRFLSFVKENGVFLLGLMMNSS